MDFVKIFYVFVQWILRSWRGSWERGFKSSEKPEGFARKIWRNLVSLKYYHRIESPGSHPANLTLKTLLKIANAFEVELAELFNFYDNENK